MLDLKMLAIAAAASGSLLGAGAAGAWAHGAGHHGLAGHGRELIHRFAEFVVEQKLDAVGATEAQKQQVRAVHDRFVQKRAGRRADRHAFAEALLAELARREPDPARVRALVRERTEAQLTLGDEAADALVELHAVFTPEQRDKLLAQARERLARHAH